MKAQELLKTIKEKTVWAAKEIWLFVSSRIFIKNLLLAIFSVSLLLILTFAFLKLYTRHGDSISLQDYSGLTLDKAKEQLKAQKLKFEVIDSSTYDADLAPQTIVMQDPIAGSRVKEKRTIYFSVNASKPPLVTIPNSIWGLDMKLAEVTLKSKGLFIDEENIQFREDKAENTVLEVIYGGERLIKPRRDKDLIKVPKGTKLGLVVAERGGGQVEVPKLVCYTYDEVKFKLSSSRLNIGVILTDETVRDTASAYVYKQIPSYSEGGYIRLGEQVDIWLTQEAPSGCLDFDLEIPSVDDSLDLEGLN